MLDPAKALFLRRRHKHAITNDRGGGVAVKRIQTENYQPRYLSNRHPLFERQGATVT